MCNKHGCSSLKELPSTRTVLSSFLRPSSCIQFNNHCNYRDGRIKVIGGSNVEGLLFSPKPLPFKNLEVCNLSCAKSLCVSAYMHFSELRLRACGNSSWCWGSQFCSQNIWLILRRLPFCFFFLSKGCFSTDLFITCLFGFDVLHYQLIKFISGFMIFLSSWCLTLCIQMFDAIYFTTWWWLASTSNMLVFFWYTYMFLLPLSSSCKTKDF